MNNSRIRWLIGVHLVLAAAPLLTIPMGLNLETMPREWALTSLPLGVLMTLSVWIGLGRTPLLWRVAIGLGGAFYLSTFSFIAHFSKVTETVSTAEWITVYLESVWELTILLFLLGGTFMLIGRRFELVQEAAPTQDEKLRFSMFQVMVLMSSVAIVLGLLRLAREATGHQSSTWETVAIYSFMIVTFFVNAACAAFAALGTGKVMRNVAMVLVVTVLLGVATAIAMHQEMAGWWLFAGCTLIVIIPTAVVLASLLVVRSCGYRLIRRTNGAKVARD